MAEEERGCAACGARLKPRQTRFCSNACYHSVPISDETRRRMSEANKGKPKSLSHRENISKGTKGKPKPWNAGERNPNYGNKAQGTPEGRANLLAGAKRRGLAWSTEDRAAHSARMLGPCNAMRGTNHTEESVAKMSAAQTDRYARGVVKLRRYHSSRAELEIVELFRRGGYETQTQFHVKGEPYLYDIYVESLNLLLEYQGDYWRGNPRRYASGTMIKINGRGSIAVDALWAKDAAKRSAAEAKGFLCCAVWEMDYARDGAVAVEAAVGAVIGRSFHLRRMAA